MASLESEAPWASGMQCSVAVITQLGRHAIRQRQTPKAQAGAGDRRATQAAGVGS